MKIDNKLILENSKSLNILYVEDDDILKKTTSKLLSNYFNSVDTASDGEKGYNKYKSYYENTQKYYDIVIADINMPNMNGIEMAKKIKSDYIDQEIIFITAHNEPSFLHEAIEIGVKAFLTKPIEVEDLQKVLYHSSLAVTDRGLVDQHYKQIEEENTLGIGLKNATSFQSAKDILEDLKKEKENISFQWVETKIVTDTLDVYQIDVEYFRSHYGIKVIEYFLNVIDGKKEIGNCPVLMDLLEFFKHKNLRLEDIFIMCVQFKNKVSSYVFSNYSFKQELFDDISLILDKNFEGVIINYMIMKGYTKKKIEKVIVKKDLIEEADKKEEIDYSDYVLEADLYELEDLEEEIDSLAISVTESSRAKVENFVQLGDDISRYGFILTNYPLFSDLGECIVKLGDNFLQNAQLLYDDKEKMSNITVLIESFVNDLIVWRKEIFINNIEDAHFLDASFISNVDTIIMFIEYDDSAEVNDDEGEFEFF